MKLSILLMVCLVSAALVLPTATAQEWLPVCKDKDVRVPPYAHLHVGVDCYPGVWLDVCLPDSSCERIDLGRVLA